MTNTLIKIIINKHSKYFACLAQSVEHSAVNRSVGGPSPSTGAKKNVKTFFFCACLETCTPAAQSCGGTLCHDTSSELDALCVVNKFTHNATSRGPFFLYKSQMDVKTFFFFVPVWDRTPCRTIVRRHFVPRHFFRTGRLTLQINLPSALLHGGPFFLYKSQMDVKSVLFFVPVLDSYTCRTVVRRHYMPQHFF